MSYQQERWLVAFIAVCIAVSYVISHSQEKDPSYPPTRTWEISEMQSQRVSVVDTAGVCLYVAWNTWDHSVAMAAVPKTQLPKGAGCQ
jgi:hypothetical protein